MKLDQKFNVENDIASVDITVTSLGTADLTSEQEKELLANYNKYIEYSKNSSRETSSLIMVFQK